MQLPSLPPPLLLLPLLTLPAFAQCALKGPTPLPPAPPALTYLFTTTINVGKPLNPIPVIGGGERGSLSILIFTPYVYFSSLTQNIFSILIVLYPFSIFSLLRKDRS